MFVMETSPLTPPGLPTRNAFSMLESPEDNLFDEVEMPILESVSPIVLPPMAPRIRPRVHVEKKTQSERKMAKRAGDEARTMEKVVTATMNKDGSKEKSRVVRAMDDAKGDL